MKSIIDKIDIDEKEIDYGINYDIKHKEIEDAEFLVKNKLVSNSEKGNLLYIEKLEDNKDNLKVIFTVDIFNEGVDIPSINLVLMLRPTSSPIIFIQQH